MMEQENEVVDTDVSEDVSVDTEEVELTVEDYRKLEERLKKAEKALVEKKKAEKANKGTQGEDVETIANRIVEEREFFKNNPEYADYKDQIKELTATGKLSLEDAKLLISNKPEFVAKAKASSMSITDGEEGSGKSVYTAAELSKLSQAEYNKVKALQQQGKVTFKR